jgi:hypothetical protein
MNPCPCGWLGSQRPCRCTPEQVARYQGKLSGPLLDRIDLHVEVPALSPAELLQAPAGEGTAAVQARCEAARTRALRRPGQGQPRLQGPRDRPARALAADAATFLRNAAAHSDGARAPRIARSSWPARSPISPGCQRGRRGTWPRPRSTGGRPEHAIDRRQAGQPTSESIQRAAWVPPCSK